MKQQINFWIFTIKLDYLYYPDCYSSRRQFLSYQCAAKPLTYLPGITAAIGTHWSCLSLPWGYNDVYQTLWTSELYLCGRKSLKHILKFHHWPPFSEFIMNNEVVARNYFIDLYTCCWIHGLSHLITAAPETSCKQEMIRTVSAIRWVSYWSRLAWRCFGASELCILYEGRLSLFDLIWENENWQTVQDRKSYIPEIGNMNVFRTCKRRG